jgi:hypothetical protein
MGRVAAERRFARVAEQVRSIRGRSGTLRADTWMLYVGGLLMPLGVLLIVLGWAGASRTPFGFEQTPYLISGGLLGLGLLFAGGFLFFGSWLARVAITSQRTAEQLAQLSAQLADGGFAAAASGNGAPKRADTAGPGKASTVRAASSGRLVATATGTMLHRADCPIVASRDNVRTVTAKEQNSLQPCQICSPLD